LTAQSLLNAQIRDETQAHSEAVREVVRRAFGRDDESSLVDALRAERAVVQSFVAVLEGRLVGHLLFSELAIVGDTARVPALALAPLAVLPAFQRRGIGSALVRHGLEVCRSCGHAIVIVLGDPDFYARFGFSSALTARLRAPFSGRPSFMAIEVKEGALRDVSGRVSYPAAFGIESL
jgi:putative acetyltransferase